MNLISLFTGCSGSDLGFINKGFNVVFCNETNKDACNTYEANLGVRPFSTPIQHIPISMLEKIRANILIGGPPCQSFSNARSRGYEGGYRSGSGLDMIKEYVRVLAIAQTDLFVCENAKTLLEPSMNHVLNQMLSWFSEAGYKVDVYCLNAEDYGVPQHRERTFFLGIRKDLYDRGKRFRKPEESHWKKFYSGWADYLGVEIPSTGVWYHARGSSIKGFSPDRATPTVLSQESPVIRYSQPQQTRKILAHQRTAEGIIQEYVTVNQLAKLQGFPADYEWVGSTDSIIQMIGNAWCVPVAEALAEEAKKCLMS